VSCSTHDISKEEAMLVVRSKNYDSCKL